MKKIFLILSTLCLFTLSSCNSLKEIPQESTPAQIIQMGQSAFDIGDYKNAENCYLTAIKRYGINIEVYIEAKYELAHTYMAEKKYNQAYPIFQEILDIYSQTAIGDLPPSFKKLAEIGISRIPEDKLPNANPEVTE